MDATNKRTSIIRTDLMATNLMKSCVYSGSFTIDKMAGPKCTLSGGSTVLRTHD